MTLGQVAGDQLTKGMVIGYLFKGELVQEKIKEVNSTYKYTEVIFESGRKKRFAKTVSFVVYDEQVHPARQNRRT